MNEVPRDVSNYYLTLHAKQQRRHRNITLEYVRETIRNGEIRQSAKRNCVLFVQEFVSKDHPVAIVANYRDGAIITIEYRK